MRRVAAIFAVMMLAIIVFEGVGQRRITPVAPPSGHNENATATDRSNLKEEIDANGNVIFIDTIAGTEVADTTVMTRVIGMVYPRFQSLTLGVNVWDGAMRALGQHYGLGSVRASLSLHNRYVPMVEVGLSTANDTPNGNNYTFRSPLAPYFKIGFGYNIFYNSNPDYQLTFGLRYCLTNFSYEVTDVTVDEGYWDDPARFSLPSQRVTAGFFEFAIGLKVKIAGPISLGWDLIYHNRLHESANRYGAPMIIPGFGKRDSKFTANFNVMYTIDLSGNRRLNPVPARTEESAPGNPFND